MPDAPLYRCPVPKYWRPADIHFLFHCAIGLLRDIGRAS
jgi:hypothetical protein